MGFRETLFFHCVYLNFRDRSFITGRGGGGGGEGGTKWEVGSKFSFTPTKKEWGGGGGCVNSAMLKGSTQSFWVVLTCELEVLAILNWEEGWLWSERKMFPKECVKGLLCLEGGGGGATCFDPRFSHFVGPPPSP